MGKEVVALIHGVADPAAKRALRALEEALNSALARIRVLEADVTDHETELSALDERVTALEP